MSIPFSDQVNFSALVDASPMPTAIYTGSDLIISHANQAMLELWGKAQSIIGKPLHKGIPELVGQPFLQILEGVYISGETYHAKEASAELIVDGVLQTFYFTFTYKAIKDTAGKTFAIINTAAHLTELVNARKTIAETQERLAFALKSAGIGTWDLDPIHNRVNWDARCRELFGFHGEAEIPYYDVLSCIHPYDEAMVRENVARAINPHHEGVYDIKYRTVSQQEGKVRWVHCKGQAYFNGEGIAFRFAGTAQDITHEVKARIREQQLLSLVDNNADHMSVADMKGNLIYMNKAGRMKLGVEEDADISKHTARDFYTVHELERVQKQIIKEISETSGWQGTINLQNFKTKEIIPSSVNYILIKDIETGEVIGRGATARDLRPEINARKILNDQNKALQNVINELEFLANTVPSIVWTSTPDGELDYINQRWYDQTGRIKKEVIDTSWTETIHPDDRIPASIAWNRALRSGDAYETEFRCLVKNNEYRWFLVRALPLKDTEGNIVKWYGTNTDVHHQKELEQQKDNFLGIASHELKTPITSMKAYAQLIETMLKRSGDLKNAELLIKMNKQIDRLTNLIADLLDVTKINTGRLQFNTTHFDFNELIEEVIEDIQRTSFQHTICKELNFHQQITGDRDQIAQVLTNLLTNAVKYSPLATEVLVSTKLAGNQLEVSIQDFGIGIEKELQPYVFDQFYRASGNHQYTFPGLGLGLYISSEIVKRMGGQIWLNSEPGNGSTFSFSIPLEE